MLRKIDISHRTIIFTVLFLLGLGFLYFVREIILMLFVSFLLMTIMNPLVNLLSRLKIHRNLSILITYVLVIGVFGGIVALITPALVQQTGNFISELPKYLSNIGINSAETSSLINGALQQIGGVLNFTFSIFSNLLSIITVLVFTFYMLVGYSSIRNQLTPLLGEEIGQKATRLIIAIEERLGGWSRGELILMLVVAVGNYIGYSLLRIPYALPLAVLTGIFEIVPILGPVISAVPAVIIGFGISPLTGIGAAGVALLVNQLENYILVPKIMQKSIGVSPLMILVSIAVFSKLAGIPGVIVAVPFVIILQVVLKEYWTKGE
jgi:predicted PurR-regulated permease PerM